MGIPFNQTPERTGMTSETKGKTQIDRQLIYMVTHQAHGVTEQRRSIGHNTSRRNAISKRGKRKDVGEYEARR